MRYYVCPLIFLIIQPHPNTTLFPYTTLFRSGAATASPSPPPPGSPPPPWRFCADSGCPRPPRRPAPTPAPVPGPPRDRKSTRLNSSHVEISYAVFCLKKK